MACSSFFSFLFTLLLVVSVASSKEGEHTVPALSDSTKVSPLAFVEKHLIYRYIIWHHKHRHSGRRLVYRLKKVQPGLGDRISALLSAFVLASFTDRVLLVDWEVPFRLFDFFKPVKIPNLKYLSVDADAAEFVCNRTMCPYHSLDILTSKHRTVVVPSLPAARMEDIQMIIRKCPQMRLSKKLANVSRSLPPSHEIFSRIFKVLLKPAPLLQKVIDGRMTGLSKPYISVHARLGRGIGEKGARFRSTLSYEDMAKCFVEVASREGKKRNVNKYYLATDTKSFRKVFQRVLMKEVKGAELIRFDNVDPIHTASCMQFKGACLHTMFELIVLSRGRAVVASRSNYSKVGAFIGNITLTEAFGKNGCKLVK